MSKPTPPSKKYLERRLQFFLDHQEFPKAKWEIFHLTNLIIVRDYRQRKLTYPQFIMKLKELDHTQGLPHPPREVTLETLAEEGKTR